MVRMEDWWKGEKGKEVNRERKEGEKQVRMVWKMREYKYRKGKGVKERFDERKENKTRGKEVYITSSLVEVDEVKRQGKN